MFYLNLSQKFFKKQLGQHFLIDQNIAIKIVNSLTFHKDYTCLLEIGPGKGILTTLLLKKIKINLKCIEKDKDLIDYLIYQLNIKEDILIFGDFLKVKLKDIFKDEFGIIGNFPYNISSQILFKVLEHYQQIPELVGMFQKEVAERITAQKNNKTYGILSVMTQAYYHTEYLFTVSEKVFIPRPLVKSAVIRMKRKESIHMPTSDFLTFKKIVTSAFQQRRKILKNSLSQVFPQNFNFSHPLFSKRAEQLSFTEFDEISNIYLKLIK